MKILKNHIESFKVRSTSPKDVFLSSLLKEYWFATQDVLLRSIEANIWEKCIFEHPVLDIGIGDGGISRFLYSDKRKIDIGIDLNEAGLEKARETGMYDKVIAASAEHMPFKDASFNTVISNSTFEHIIHDTKAVVEVGRVLKKGGYFFLTVPSAFLPKFIVLLEGGKANPKAKKTLTAFNKRLSHFHYRTLSAWKSILAKNKLNIVFSAYYYPLSTTVVWYRLFKFSTTKIAGKELWSYLGHSKMRKIIPEKLVIFLLKNYILASAYKKGYFTHGEVGSMLFFVAQKVS